MGVRACIMSYLASCISPTSSPSSEPLPALPEELVPEDDSAAGRMVYSLPCFSKNLKSLHGTQAMAIYDKRPVGA